MITPTTRPPCSYPPDCPFAGGTGECYEAIDRTPAEKYSLWRNCFGAEIADRLLAEWIADTEAEAAVAERHANSTVDGRPTWAAKAYERKAARLAELRALRPAEVAA